MRGYTSIVCNSTFPDILSRHSSSYFQKRSVSIGGIALGPIASTVQCRIPSTVSQPETRSLLEERLLLLLWLLDILQDVVESAATHRPLPRTSRRRPAAGASSAAPATAPTSASAARRRTRRRAPPPPAAGASWRRTPWRPPAGATCRRRCLCLPGTAAGGGTGGVCFLPLKPAIFQVHTRTLLAHSRIDP